jgi:hypothetical protein
LLTGGLIALQASRLLSLIWQGRLDGMLDLLAKRRSLHRLPIDLANMVDNAMYTCKPPEKSAIVQASTHPVFHDQGSG